MKVKKLSEPGTELLRKWRKDREQIEDAFWGKEFSVFSKNLINALVAEKEKSMPTCGNCGLKITDSEILCSRCEKCDQIEFGRRCGINEAISTLIEQRDIEVAIKELEGLIS